MRTAVLAPVVIALALAACGSGEDGPSCDKVAAKAASILGTDDVAGLARTCRKAHWPAEMKRCVMGAQDERHLAGCKPRRSGLVDGVVAFAEYEKKAEGTEAKLAISAAQKGLRAHWAEDAALPVGHAGPTPPIDACCHQDEGRCAPDPAQWSDPIWAAIDFEIDDPTRYSYEYESTDGRTAVFRALADLDCDGTPSVTEMTCSSADGDLQCAIGEPTTD